MLFGSNVGSVLPYQHHRSISDKRIDPIGKPLFPSPYMPSIPGGGGLLRVCNSHHSPAYEKLPMQPAEVPAVTMPSITTRPFYQHPSPLLRFFPVYTVLLIFLCAGTSGARQAHCVGLGMKYREHYCWVPLNWEGIPRYCVEPTI